MYLIDTDVISEIRKRSNANQGVQIFFRQVIHAETPVFISVVSLGELRRGVDTLVQSVHRVMTTAAPSFHSFVEGTPP